MSDARRLVRIVLLSIGVPNLINGIAALAAPRLWFDTLNVGALGGYNDHLVRDVGEAFIAVSVLALLAAYFLDRHVVMAAATVWIVYSLPHFINHIVERGDLSTGNYLASLFATGYPVVLAAIALSNASKLPLVEES
jgi:hypothetical protein